jgi:hypothetical protein
MSSNMVLKWSILLLSALLSLSCSTTSYKEVYPLLMDGKYDSEFPYRGCSAQLEKIAESVRMISCIAYYKSYFFRLKQKFESGIFKIHCSREKQ